MIWVCLYVYECALIERCVCVLCCVSCLSFLLHIYMNWHVQPAYTQIRPRSLIQFHNSSFSGKSFSRYWGSVLSSRRSKENTAHTQKCVGSERVKSANRTSLTSCIKCRPRPASPIHFFTLIRLTKSSLLSVLTLRPPSTTTVPYANSLDPDETASNSPSHSDPSCLTLRQHFHNIWATLKQFENWYRWEI